MSFIGMCNDCGKKRIGGYCGGAFLCSECQNIYLISQANVENVVDDYSPTLYDNVYGRDFSDNYLHEMDG